MTLEELLAVNSLNEYLDLADDIPIDEQLSLLNKAIEIESDRAFLYEIRASVFVNDEQAEAAFNDIDMAVSLNDGVETKRVKILRGYAYLVQGEFVRAALSFEALAVKEKEFASEGWYIASRARFETREYVKALENLNKSLDIDEREGKPIDTDKLFMRSEIFDQLDQFDFSMKDLNKIIEIDNTDIDARSKRGKMLFDKDNFPAALEDINIALAVEPTDLDNLACRSAIYFKTEQFDKYQRDIETLSKLDPEEITWKFQLADIFFINGDVEKAKKLLMEALKLDGENMFVKSQLGIYELSEGNYHSAVKYLTEATKNTEISWHSTYALAYALWKAGEWEEAEKHLKIIRGLGIKAGDSEEFAKMGFDELMEKFYLLDIDHTH